MITQRPYGHATLKMYLLIYFRKEAVFAVQTETP